MAKNKKLLFFRLLCDRSRALDEKKKSQKKSMDILDQDCLQAPSRSLAFYKRYGKN